MRDIIIDEVVTSPIKPSTPTNYIPQIPYDISEHGTIRVSSPTTTPLASTCSQLRAEILQRTSKASIPAILDIFVHPDGTTQCTWLSCPISHSPLNLQINIRVQPIDVELALDTQSGVGELSYIPNDDEPYASLWRVRQILGGAGEIATYMSKRSCQFLSVRIREAVLNIIGDRPPMQPIKSMRIDVSPVIDHVEEIPYSELYGRVFNGLPTAPIFLQRLHCDMFKQTSIGPLLDEPLEETSKAQSRAFFTHLKKIVYSYRGGDGIPKTVKSVTLHVDKMLQHDEIELPSEEKEAVLALRASHGW